MKRNKIIFILLNEKTEHCNNFKGIKGFILSDHCFLDKDKSIKTLFLGTEYNLFRPQVTQYNTILFLNSYTAAQITTAVYIRPMGKWPDIRPWISGHYLDSIWALNL